MITSPHNDKLKEIRRLKRAARGALRRRGRGPRRGRPAAGWQRGVPARGGRRRRAGAARRGLRARLGHARARRLRAALGDAGRPAVRRPAGASRDPGNVGTVLRSALAFGAACVALGPDCADPYCPKAVRASMGAIFALDVAKVADPAELPGERVALVARAPASRSRAARRSRCTLVVGAEREGLPADVVAACDRVAQIPIASESLNAAMAASVALYEVTAARPGAATTGRAPETARVGAS